MPTTIAAVSAAAILAPLVRYMIVTPTPAAAAVHAQIDNRSSNTLPSGSDRASIVDGACFAVVVTSPPRKPASERLSSDEHRSQVGRRQPLVVARACCGCVHVAPRTRAGVVA